MRTRRTHEVKLRISFPDIEMEVTKLYNIPVIRNLVHLCISLSLFELLVVVINPLLFLVQIKMLGL